MKVMRLEANRARTTIGYAFLALVAMAVILVAQLYRTNSLPPRWRPSPDSSPTAPRIVILVALLFAICFLATAVFNARRWHLGVVVERLSNDQGLASLRPPPMAAVPAERATERPELEVLTLKARKLPKPPSRLRRVTLERNVIGARPIGIAYLRLFENLPRIRTFLQGAWREFGYVYLLRSASSVTPAEYRSAKRSDGLASLFMRSPQELLPVFDQVGVEPKRRKRFKTVGPKSFTVWDRFGSYRLHPLLCHGEFWKESVDLLLERVDVVVLDLSGLRPMNAGTRYELQRVVDRFPIERVVFLVDQYSDKDFITQQVRGAWSQMAQGSPNAGAGTRRAVVVVTDVVVHRQNTQAQQMTTGPRGSTMVQSQSTYTPPDRLAARRRETRRVAAMAQHRMAEWRFAQSRSSRG
jgi:hypothetical protein